MTADSAPVVAMAAKKQLFNMHNMLDYADEAGLYEGLRYLAAEAQKALTTGNSKYFPPTIRDRPKVRAMLEAAVVFGRLFDEFQQDTQLSPTNYWLWHRLRYDLTLEQQQRMFPGQELPPADQEVQMSDSEDDDD